MSKEANWVALQTTVAAIGVLTSIAVSFWATRTPPTIDHSAHRRLDQSAAEIATLRARLERLETTPDRIPIFRPGRR
ncbi:hypothetical protein [Allorhodopirellula heiligendammensis]|uniref:hypothetical protein n=1 Tax=Allorhodopirellula heiligendammensis TaxID=2714739 RepID=UPI0011B6B5A5|nr:hypothetical protein [Allorhodopirellula heiligendammensis]